MKKVKVMLASIAVLAVIGGAVAFKAKSAFSGVIYTTVGTNTNPGAATACNTENLLKTTTTVRPGTQALIYYTVANAPAPCYTTTLGVQKFYTTTAD